MYNIVAICGKAGSGKDTILRALVDAHSEYNEIVSCTTRPPREGEIDGFNYHFLTSDQFSEQLLNGEMLEATVFREWCYGTSTKSLDENKINIGVFNPAGIDTLHNYPGYINLLTIYIVTDDKERLIRQLNREEHPDIEEIIRRYSTDKEDFSDYPDILFNYSIIENQKDTSIQDIVVQINNLITIFGQNIEKIYS